jgi:AraC-like DNA-binding protein
MLRVARRVVALQADLPLAGHESFRALSVDEIADKVTSNLGGRLLAARRDRAVDARANCRRLATSELWFCSYGIPVTISFPAGDYFRVQLSHTGAGATLIRDEATAVTAMQSCVSSAAAIIDFGADFQQLAWRISRAALVKKLVALTGVPVTRDLNFDSALQLTKPRSQSFQNILRCLLTTIGRSDSPGPPLVLAELEQALIVSFLCGSRHDFSHLLNGVPPTPSPWRVRRAEQFIDENWDKPLMIEDLVAATGASARSIYRAFRQSRGCTPQEFIKRRRLSRAREMLTDRSAIVTVTSVAFACGFNDVSHFSKDFAKAFGEPPSALLKKP